MKPELILLRGVVETSRISPHRHLSSRNGHAAHPQAMAAARDQSQHAGAARVGITRRRYHRTQAAENSDDVFVTGSVKWINGRRLPAPEDAVRSR